MKREVIRILTVLALVLSLFIFTACSENDDTDSDSDKDIKDSVYNKTEEDNKDEENNKVEDDKENNVKNNKEDDDEIISEADAKKLLEEYYEIAENMYYLSFDELDVDYDNVINDSMYKIKNYEDIMEKYFSEDFRDEFTPALLIKEKGEYFLGFGGFAEYKENMKFENIEIESQKISCIVSYNVSVPDEVIEKDAKSKFILVKEDDEWKIEHYSYESEDISSIIY